MSSNSWPRIFATAPIVSALRGRESPPPSRLERASLPRSSLAGALLVTTAIAYSSSRSR